MDFVCSKYATKSYTGDDRVVNVPEGMRRVDSGTFAMCRNLEEVIVPSSVVYIDTGAFRECMRLKRVEIKGSVAIANSAFFRCPKLDTVIIDGAINVAYSDSFHGCPVEVVYKDAKYFKINGNPHYLLASVLKSMRSFTPSSKCRYAACDFLVKCNGIERLEFNEGFLWVSGSSQLGVNKQLENVSLPCSIVQVSKKDFDSYGFFLQLFSSTASMSRIKYNKYSGGEYLGNKNNPYAVLMDVVDSNVFRIHPECNTLGGEAITKYNKDSIVIPSSVKSLGSYQIEAKSSVKAVVFEGHEFIYSEMFYTGEDVLFYFKDLDFYLFTLKTKFTEVNYTIESLDKMLDSECDVKSKSIRLSFMLYRYYVKGIDLRDSVKKNLKAIMELLCFYKNERYLRGIINDGLFSKSNIDAYINMAIESEFSALQVLLIEYKKDVLECDSRSLKL